MVKKVGTKFTTGREAHAVICIWPDKANKTDGNNYSTSPRKNEIGHKNSTKTALVVPIEGPHLKFCADK